MKLSFDCTSLSASVRLRFLIPLGRLVYSPVCLFALDLSVSVSTNESDDLEKV